MPADRLGGSDISRISSLGATSIPYSFGDFSTITFFLAFIDENETDRVLEGRWDGDDEFEDLGESLWLDNDEGGQKPVAAT